MGIKPAALFRSRDDGQSWTKLPVDMAQYCHIGPPMVTALMVDPKAHNTVWAGVEVDGVYRSLDGGDTWTHITTGVHPDIHGMAISPGEENKVLFSTPREIYYTTDVGESWESLNTTNDLPLPYSRGIAFKADDPNVLFSALGESAISSQGALRRSHRWGQDLGESTAARGAQLQHLGFRNPPGRPRLHPGVQPVWRALLHRRRRGFLEQAQARVHRDRLNGLGPQLEPAHSVVSLTAETLSIRRRAEPICGPPRSLRLCG